MSERIHTPLLPPNQTRLEARLAHAAAMAHTPEVLAQLWDAQRCPVELLPWLAWALSVDEWDGDWTEAQQRAAVRESISLHRKKGTPWAVKRAIANAGIDRVSLVEHPAGAHWAEFDLDISIADRPITDAMLDKLVRLVNAYKPARSHLRRIAMSAVSRLAARVAIATVSGDVVTLAPYKLTSTQAPSMGLRVALCLHCWGPTTVYPR